MRVFLLSSMLLALSAGGCHSQTAQSGDPMVDREITMLEFIGGGTPLTALERQQAAGVVAMAMRTAPQRWKIVDANLQKIIPEIQQHNVPSNNRLREQDRYAYAFGDPDTGGLQQEFLIEKRIVEAHDPVLVADPAHRRMLTAHMLITLRQTSAWVARSYHLPPPNPNFSKVVVEHLQAQFATVDQPIADGIAHIESNAWFAPSYFDHLPAAKRTAFFSNRKQFNNLNDESMEQWEIAESAGMMARFAAQQAPSSNGNTHAMLSERLLEQQMQMKALQGAARSFSPACNVTVGSYSDRAANGCYP